MDDVYAINVAKTEIREAYNTGDSGRFLAVLDENFIDNSDGRSSGYGQSGRNALREYLNGLFDTYHARLAPIIIEVKVMGDMALAYGWHELTLTPKRGGEPHQTRTRYLELSKRNKAGQWRLAMFMDNADVPDRVSTIAA